MRIGVNARFLLPEKLEGIGWYSYQILKRMVDQHPEHEYFFFYDRKQNNLLLQHPSIHHIVVSPPARHPLLWYFWFEWSLPAAFKKNKINCVFHPDGYCSLSANIPQVMVVHDLAYLHFPEQVPLLVRKYYQYFVPRQIKKANHLIAVSKATASDIAEHFPEMASKISIGYNGVRECFKPLDDVQQKEIRQQFSQGVPYSLFVGAIHPRKNVTGLIHAFEIFKTNTGSEMKLMIVGRKAWFVQDFEKTINTSAFKTDIILLDYMQSLELAKITASAFAVVQPSFLEGFGVPVLEALNCDIPVLVADCFSLPEVAGPGAYLFDPYKPPEIAEQMEIALKDSHRAEKIQLGRTHRTQFDWDKSAEIIYFQIISNAKA
ncbi:MAG: glycosyltransferase family 4 protein [Saprospiraceae bacterium]|nr:glycosyltransferase family 4 protein [Saprospiraceae bacterium]